MTKTLTAPDITPGYPSKGKKIGRGWRAAWKAMEEAPGEFLDGWELATAAAQGISLAPVTLVAVIRRAANAGLLEREERPVRVKILDREGTRKRMFYRIAQQDEA
jgi:hypothetical protein